MSLISGPPLGCFTVSKGRPGINPVLTLQRPFLPGTPRQPPQTRHTAL
jgi:hypothetical protein